MPGVRGNRRPAERSSEQENKVRIVHVMGNEGDHGSGGGSGKPRISISSGDFAAKYELQEQIGKGASSTVWRCARRADGDALAAKVMDLRPLKFRERFSMERLRREVDIMRQLRHPNIVRLEDVFETDEQLVLVLEYARGVELFDAILACGHYSEDDARPIFLQVARALYYLHSLQILHRDVKPENIMIRERKTADGLYPEAKLLDFGLSKMVGEDMGSAARTFVGTPCYLAPEVDLRGQGQGGSYGTAVDCWSLGAVLYVMLAARFPEFAVPNTPGARPILRMEGPMWSGVSDSAKALIRGLMAQDPTQRLTVDQALRSAWATNGSAPPATAAALPVPLTLWGQEPPLQQVSPPPPAFPPKFPLLLGAPPAPDAAARVVSPPPPLPSSVQPPAVVRPSAAGAAASADAASISPSSSTATAAAAAAASSRSLAVQAAAAGGVNLAPLLQLHGGVAAALEAATRAFGSGGGGGGAASAAALRRGALLCRENLLSSVKLLRKMEHTAAAVLELFPDLTLAVEEREPALAREFFATVRAWVGELYAAVKEVQQANQANAHAISDLMRSSVGEHHPHNALEDEPAAPSAAEVKAPGSTSPKPPPPPLSDAMAVDRGALEVMERMQSTDGGGGHSGSGVAAGGGGDEEQLLDLFLRPPMPAASAAAAAAGGGSASGSAAAPVPPGKLCAVIGGAAAAAASASSGAKLEGISSTGSLASDTGAASGLQSPVSRKMSVETTDAEPPLPQPEAAATAAAAVAGGAEHEVRAAGLHLFPLPAGGASTPRDALADVQHALQLLHEMDGVLEQLALLWANAEVTFHLLLQKGDLVEKFVSFAHKPRLLGRFQERMAEYERFWEGIRQLCSHYIRGDGNQSAARAYAYLDEATRDSAAASVGSA